MFKKQIKSSKGAVDLSSIMVGVTVVGILGGVIAATTFTVIPWAQDNAARQQLSSIAYAQQAYVGTQTPANLFSFSQTVMPAAAAANLPTKYGSLKDLTSNGILKFDLKEGSETVSADGKICTAYDATTDIYNAAVKSDTGKIFIITSNDLQPVKAPNDSYNCLGKIDSGGVLNPGEAPPTNTMVSTWNTSFPGCTTIEMPLQKNVKADVDWGDGNTSKGVGDNPAHTYTDTPGEKTITVTGTFDKWGSDFYKARNKCITKVTSWGETGTTDLAYAFAGAENLTQVRNIPTGVTELGRAFWLAKKFNGDLSNWDTSNVTDMSYMFEGATTFNGDLSNWDTSNVTDMSWMFKGSSVFNGDLSNWDTSKVTSMYSMFFEADAFKGDVSGWDTSNVTNMSQMFSGAKVFNSNLSEWNTSKVTDMGYMFYKAPLFNSNLSKWDTSNVTIMQYMFASTQAFNTDVSMWDVTNVTEWAAFNSWSNLEEINVPYKFNVY